MPHATCTGVVVTARAAGRGDFRGDVRPTQAHQSGAALDAVFFPSHTGPGDRELAIRRHSGAVDLERGSIGKRIGTRCGLRLIALTIRVVIRCRGEQLDWRGGAVGVRRTAVGAASGGFNTRAAHSFQRGVVGLAGCAGEWVAGAAHADVIRHIIAAGCGANADAPAGDVVVRAGVAGPGEGALIADLVVARVWHTGGGAV